MTYSGQEGRGGRGGLVQQREALSRLPALLLAHRVHRLAHPPPVSISIILGTTGLKSHKLYVSHLHFMIKTYNRGERRKKPEDEKKKITNSM